MVSSILVPLDGSKFGEHALPYALKIARQTGARLQLAHVHVPLAPVVGEGVIAYDVRVDEELRKNERAYLDKLIPRLAEVAPVPASAVLLEGEIADELEAHVAGGEVDLIVMTTHGRGTLARSWLGSVADQLVRRAPVPVLLIRPHEALRDLTQEPSLEHVLIPLDGSPLAEQILEPAMKLAASWAADFTLVRVIKPVVLGGYVLGEKPPEKLGEAMLADLTKLHEAERKEAERYLNALADRLKKKSLRVETRVLIHEQPAVAILDEMKARHIDLVALATHGRSGLPRLFLGSVADKILRGTAVPILVQRPPSP
jgi:nucleotide-binding universal stress UspA family protein